MPNQGYSWVSLLAALAIAASLTGGWLSLWQQQHFLQQVQHWRLQLLQLQQAQRNHFQQFGQFADSQQQLVTNGLLSARSDSPFATAWQFTAQQNILLMSTTINLNSVELLMKDFNGYLWQAPQLTVKVVGYEQP